MTTRQAPVADDWIGLTEARSVLGLSASTLRRLADSGTVRTFVTPGGHRRFLRHSVEALLPPPPGDLPHVADLGETPHRLTRICRRTAVREASGLPWIGTLEGHERSRFRALGRRIVAGLLAALDAADAGSRRRALVAARSASAVYGREAAVSGVPASLAVDIFLRMRRPVLVELGALARRRDLDAAATTLLLERAGTALDDLLLAMLRAYGAGAADAGAADAGAADAAAASAAGDPAGTGRGR